MKTIGLIGGIGWPSSLEYYRILNQKVAQLYGAGHSAKINLLSIDQKDFVSLAAMPDKNGIKEFLLQTFARLANSGAEVAAICANGAHRFKSLFANEITLEFVDLIEETANFVANSGSKCVGLLGVKETMSGSFYQKALADRGVSCIVPNESDQVEIHRIIYAELLENRLSKTSKEFLVETIINMQNKGAQAVILGCTELPMFLHQSDASIPLFSTTEIHCNALIKAAFSKDATVTVFS